MCTVYIINSIIFGILLPVLSYFDIGGDPETRLSSWKVALLRVEWLKYLGDDIFLMSMVYVLHHFGPYR